MTLDAIHVQNNRVLVLLPPAPEVDERSGLILAEAMPTPVSYGRVLKVGPRVRDVAPGDMVAFPPEVGDPYPLTEAHMALFVREPDIAAILQKKDVV